MVERIKGSPGRRFGIATVTGVAIWCYGPVGVLWNETCGSWRESGWDRQFRSDRCVQRLQQKARYQRNIRRAMKASRLNVNCEDTSPIAPAYCPALRSAMKRVVNNVQCEDTSQTPNTGMG